MTARLTYAQNDIDSLVAVENLLLVARVFRRPKRELVSDGQTGTCLTSFEHMLLLLRRNVHFILVENVFVVHRSTAFYKIPFSTIRIAYIFFSSASGEAVLRGAECMEYPSKHHARPFYLSRCGLCLEYM